jgi:RNase P subunit RPR2
MLLYCPKCQRLLDKDYEERKEGDTIEKECDGCGAKISFSVRYKVVSKIIDRH